ncbi:ADP-ribosylglycohydrolase family protein [Selenomonas sp. AE3005]|uniref:ADP-ribosylglycohydrolase family protein n=1 Tax=Selenomonas sp. AE3005 TaxID=1485543 RepID=UPI0009DE66FB|nr:ADP-ribosylglycohydrolase family protein [Selenomonas sp. AE3005]
MYGAILGDIIGSPYEFDRGAKIKEFPLFVAKNRFTDDTVMTIAVADALLYAGKDAMEDKICAAVVSSMQHWGEKYPKAGYGGRFREWLKEKEPKPYGSFGNGSAMRVSSVGWLYDSIERTRDIARWTAEVTHNHAEGIKGAESVASAIYLARTGESKATIKKYIEDEFGYNLARTLKEIRPAYHMDVTCQGSVPEAIIAFLESTDFEDAVRNAVSIGGDTDTIACIAGSIAEAYYGLTPMLEEECLKRIPNKMKDVIIRFDRARGKAVQGEPIIESALLRYHRDSSPENETAVLNAIYMRMKDNGYFLLPPSEVRIFDECAAKGDYDGEISIEAYTSDREFFMGLDEEDESAVYTTEVKIYDLLSFIAKATDAESGIDINYDKKIYLSRDMARSILARGGDMADRQKRYLPMPDKINILPKDLTQKFISGVRFCFMCAYDAYTNYCELYHRNGKIYRYDIFGDNKQVEKICRVFPAFKKYNENDEQNAKLGEWEWNYCEMGACVFAHAEVIDAYKMRTGHMDYLTWSPDDAYMTIRDLLEEEDTMFEPMKIDKDVLHEISDYQHDREGIPAGWVYLGNDKERYVLGWPGERNILVLGVNPSTAKPGEDDPTIKNVRRIAKNKGFDGWIMMNLHPQRATNPEEMEENDVWSENNPRVFEAVMRYFQVHAVWCAWGNMIDMTGKRFLYGALANIYDVLGENVKWYSYGKLTKYGNPRHPLYMSLTHEFQEFDVRGYLLRKGK